MQVVSDGSIDVVPSSPLQLPPNNNNNNNNNNLKYNNSNKNKIIFDWYIFNAFYQRDFRCLGCGHQFQRLDEMQTHVCGPVPPLLQIEAYELNEDEQYESAPAATLGVYTVEANSQDQQGPPLRRPIDEAILPPPQQQQQQQPTPSNNLLKECDQCHKAFKLVLISLDFGTKPRFVYYLLYQCHGTTS